MVQVRVSEGLLEGELTDNEWGDPFYSFKGIPYAQPPLGDLRFKSPQPAVPWDGVRSAKEFGPICYQNDFLFTQLSSIGSEDCLYLNVYTSDLRPTIPLPVMFWIHGGGFICGSGNDDYYGPEFLIRHGVVLVTINYRLEALGYLCLDTEDIPGNAGMKDQVAALRWVKNNIKNFGGDSDNITIFGESAGSASVSYHLMSPMSKGLFKRAILQSGTAICPWALNTFEPRERALALAKSLGFNSNDDKELYEFFKSLPVESLSAIKTPIIFSEQQKANVDLFFGVVSEKKFGNSERFFYGDVFDPRGMHEGVDIISGYTEDEGVFIPFINDFEKMTNQANIFREFFVPKPISLNCSIKTQLKVGEKIRNYYFKKANVSKETLEPFLKFLSFYGFIYGVIQWSNLCASTGRNKVYLYKFTCKTERNLLSRVFNIQKYVGDRPSACHADDLPYIFPIKSVNQKIGNNSKIVKSIDNMTRLWTNFAKYGNPTPDDNLGVKWSPYSIQNQDFLNIGEDLIADTAPDAEQFNFWLEIYREYLQH